MKNLILIISATLTVAIQIGLTNFFTLPYTILNFALVIIFLVLILVEKENAFWFLIFSALLLDLTSPYFFGFFLLLLTLIFLGLETINRYLPLKQNPYFALSFFFFSSLLVFGAESFWAKTPYQFILFSAFYTAFFAFLILVLIDYFLKNETKKPFR